MFSALPITVAFITMFAATFALMLIEKRRWYAAERPALITGLVAAVYCVAAGLFLIVGWQDPLAGAATEEVVHRRGTGLVILIIRFWPYALIGLGGYFAYSTFDLLRSGMPRRY